MSIEVVNLTGFVLSFLGGGGIAFPAAAWLCASPHTQFWGEVITAGPRSEHHEIALTFDDGPHGEFTPIILDTLKAHGVLATFFLVGRNVERYPDVVKRIADEGHVIGGHTWDHHHHGYLGGRRYWQEQFDRTDTAIERIIGRRPTMFRPPMGVKTVHIMQAAVTRGQKVIGWSRRGFDGIKTRPEAIARRLGPTVQSGDIVVLHDGVEPHSRRSPAATAAALPMLLKEWQQRDLHLVSLTHWLEESRAASDTFLS